MKKNVAKNIKFLRKTRKLTQRELAELLGITVRHMQNIEYGQVDVSVDFVSKLASVFDVQPNIILCDCPEEEEGRQNLNELPTGIQYSDTQGLITYCNERATYFYGYAAEDVIGKKYVWEFVKRKEEVQELKEYLQHLLAERPEPTPYKTVNKTKTNGDIPVQCNWNYVLNDEGEVIGFITSLSKM